MAMKINFENDAFACRKRPMTADEARRSFGPCKTLGYPKGVDGVGMSDSPAFIAQDEALYNSGAYSLLQHTMSVMGAVATFPQFVGYGVLSNLSQDGLIRSGVGMRADEMTRKWIELKKDSKPDEEDAEPSEPTLDSFVNGVQYDALPHEDTLVQEITGEMKKIRVQKLFHDAAEMSGFFGGCLAYIDVGDLSDADLATPLYLDDKIFPVGSLRGFRLIEPYNIAPGMYNTGAPYSEDYFRPEYWYVLGTRIHKSRFLYFAENRPPTLLLPSYNFFGIPLAQTVLDAVTHFTECREAEARLVNKFSMTVFKTDMGSFLQGGAGDEVAKRIQYMVQNRSNDGIEAIDSGTEDIVEISTPISGVTDIVRQAMEIVAAYFGEPAVKLWGISPAGFNATGESDMMNHYDHVTAQQERIFRQPLEDVLKILQLNSGKAPDDALTFKFASLGADSEATIVGTQKVRADILTELIDRNIIDSGEARKILAEDPQSGFADLDLDKGKIDNKVQLQVGEDPANPVASTVQPHTLPPLMP